MAQIRCKSSLAFLLALIKLGLASLVEGKQVKMIIEICRHGARMETVRLNGTDYDKFNPFYDKTIELGDLTQVGMHAHYLLGKEIRKEYSALIPEKYNSMNVEVVASSFNRTILSAQSQLFGIFDLTPQSFSETTEISHPSLANINDSIEFSVSERNNAVRIPIISNPTPARNLIFVPSHETCCPKLSPRVAQAARRSNDFTAAFKSVYETLIQNGYTSYEYTGKQEYNFIGAKDVCDFIVARTWNDPKFTANDQLIDQCLDILAFFEMSYFFEKDLYRTYSSKLNQKVIDTLTNYRDYPDQRNRVLTLLSGHDTNIASFLLNFYPENAQCILNKYQRIQNFVSEREISLSENVCINHIKFTSNFIIELSEKDVKDKFWVTVKLNNKALPIANGSTEISLSEFLTILQQNIDPDFDFNCGADAYQSIAKVDSWLLIALALSFLVIIGLCWIIFNHHKSRKTIESFLPRDDSEIIRINTSQDSSRN